MAIVHMLWIVAYVDHVNKKSEISMGWLVMYHTVMLMNQFNSAQPNNNKREKNKSHLSTILSV